MSLMDPLKILKQFGLGDISRVADLGAGSGFYTLAAAKLLHGGLGKVYACEIQQEMVKRLRHEVANHNLSKNVEVLWVNIEKKGGTHLAEKSMDVVIISNVLFQVEDKNSFIREVSRILKNGGKVLLVDWEESFKNMGPHQDHVVPKKTALTLFERGGFSVHREIDAGPHHYGLVLHKA